MTLPPAVSAALAQRDAARFCTAILPAVSRTFALGIIVLGEPASATRLAAAGLIVSGLVLMKLSA